MTTDMSAYGVTELSPEEASTISAGFAWAAIAAAFLAAAAAAATVAGWALSPGPGCKR